MLILTRRVGETIMINNDIRVVIMGINDKGVRIGIDAPPNVSIHRQEVYDSIKKAEEKFSEELKKLDEKKPATKVIVKNRAQKSAFPFSKLGYANV